MRNTFRYNPRAKTKRTYPKHWDSLTSDLKARDGDRCFRCGKTRKELSALGYRLVKAHNFSVRTGNNRKTNLRLLCDGGRDGGCHAKDPKHEHLRKRSVFKATGYKPPKKGRR